MVLNYDKFQKNYDNLYRVHTDIEDMFGSSFFERYLSQFPEPKQTLRFKRLNAPHQSNNTNIAMKGFTFVDPTVFDIFTIQVMEGNPAVLEEKPFSLLLSENYVRKIFGQNNPLGKIIKYNKKYDFEVVGIFKDLPNNSHLTINAIASFDSWETIRFTENINGLDANSCGIEIWFLFSNNY